MFYQRTRKFYAREKEILQDFMMQKYVPSLESKQV